MLEALQSAGAPRSEPPAVQFGSPGAPPPGLQLLEERGGRGPESIVILASLAEYYDDDTPAHSARVGRSAALIAQKLGCDPEYVRLLRQAAPLHDIGKIGISRRVLLKPELTPAERENMMRHVTIGGHVLGAGRSPALRLAAEIARTHHERWDGEGYMIGLEGEEIPLAGRITAVADVFDVLTHIRPYKPAWEVDRAVEEMRLKSGQQFDPHVIEAFCQLDPEALLELPEDIPASATQPSHPPEAIASDEPYPGRF